MNDKAKAWCESVERRAGISWSTPEWEVDAAKELRRMDAENADLNRLRDGDVDLVLALAKDLGIDIYADRKIPGFVWEKFREAVIVMKHYADDARKTNTVLVNRNADLVTEKLKMASELETVHKANAELVKGKLARSGERDEYLPLPDEWANHPPDMFLPDGGNTVWSLRWLTGLRKYVRAVVRDMDRVAPTVTIKLNEFGDQDLITVPCQKEAQ